MTTLYFKKLNSTNQYALENASVLQNKDLIITDEQTSGKGRNGKRWVSPQSGNIYVSYIIKTKEKNIIQTSWIGGLATLKTLRTLPGLNGLWIKWPNDVFCKKSKISGILCESVLSSSLNTIPSTVVIGIGINVNSTAEDFKGIPQSCTSVLLETGKKSNIVTLRTCLKKNLDFYYDKAVSKGIQSLYVEWKNENKLIGNTVTVTDSQKTYEVKVLDIDRKGTVIGVDKNGEIRKVLSGDVSVKKFRL
ncbi:MAG: biotin--[acetyl-CoA-carboxylase] ligase [Victivallales bacterium]|nr:biotin--[acetyl-CoA-carboxylase] ligase [Victivallales bacterium]